MLYRKIHFNIFFILCVLINAIYPQFRRPISKHMVFGEDLILEHPYSRPMMVRPNLVSLPLIITDSDQPLVEMCFGTPTQCFKLKVVTNFAESFVVMKQSDRLDGFDITESSSLKMDSKEIDIEFAFSNLKGNKASDKLYIKYLDIQINDFGFYIIKDGFTSEDYSGVLGLGQLYSELKYSFLYMLCLNKVIDKQMFSFNFPAVGKEGSLNLGEHLHTRSKEYRTIEMINQKESKYFQTYLTNIMLNGGNDVKVYNKNQTVLFSPGSNKIYCPKKFFNKIISKYIVEVKDEFGLCEVVEEKKYKVIACSKKFIQQGVNYLGDIRFIFGKWSISFQIANLFHECAINKVCFDIIYIQGNKQWVMGYPFLKRVSVIFDKEAQLMRVKPNKQQD